MLYGGNIQKYTKCFKQTGTDDIPKKGRTDCESKDRKKRKLKQNTLIKAWPSNGDLSKKIRRIERLLEVSFSESNHGPKGSCNLPIISSNYKQGCWDTLSVYSTSDNN